MRLKKHILVTLLTLAVVSSACKTKYTEFTIAYNLELAKPVQQESFISISSTLIDTDCRIKFEQNDTKRSKVRNVFLRHLTFSISESANQGNKNELKNIFISSPNYPEKKIDFRSIKATAENKQIQIQVIDSKLNLLEFIKDNQFSMRFEFKDDESFSNIDIPNATVDFYVEGILIKTNLYHKILV